VTSDERAVGERSDRAGEPCLRKLKMRDLEIEMNAGVIDPRRGGRAAKAALVS
jgi:hypothetical protein